MGEGDIEPAAVGVDLEPWRHRAWVDWKASIGQWRHDVAAAASPALAFMAYRAVVREPLEVDSLWPILGSSVGGVTFYGLVMGLWHLAAAPVRVRDDALARAVTPPPSPPGTFYVTGTMSDEELERRLSERERRRDREARWTEHVLNASTTYRLLLSQVETWADQLRPRDRAYFLNAADPLTLANIEAGIVVDNVLPELGPPVDLGPPPPQLGDNPTPEALDRYASDAAAYTAAVVEVLDRALDRMPEDFVAGFDPPPWWS